MLTDGKEYYVVNTSWRVSRSSDYGHYRHPIFMGNASSKNKSVFDMFSATSVKFPNGPTYTI